VTPRRCEVGTVIAHEAHEEHADYFPTDGVCVNVYRADHSTGGERAVAAALTASPPRDWREAFNVIERLLGRAFDDSETARPAPPSWLGRVLREFDWTSSASLREAAEFGGIHPAHLARAFRSHLGITPGAYRRRARINAASAQLLSSSASLAQIAAEAGFYDQSDFSHQFFAASGLTPGRFRSIFRR
jgi:AraC-like DNA-binding protein